MKLSTDYSEELCHFLTWIVYFSINVEREEEEIIGPLPLSHADGSASNTEGMLNFDAISEKVDLGMKDGAAQLAVKVR